MQFYFIRSFININELIKSILIFIPAAFIMYMGVSYVGLNMKPNIITNIIQGITGIVIYVVVLEIFYRYFHKMSFVTYVKKSHK